MSRERAGAWLRWGLFALAAALIARAVMRQWAGVSDGLATVGWSRVALATGLAVVALAFNTLSWRTVMMSVGLRAPLREASGVFLVSQAGKYVPGAVWPVVAQAEFAREQGVTRARATVGSLVAMAVGVVMAAVVGAVALAVFSPGSVLRYWWVLLIAAALAATLVPAVLTRLLALALRVLRREGEPPRISGKALAASAGWSGLNWAALGAQAWVLLAALGGSDATYGLATGAFALAWLVGFLAVFAPAGAVVREGALIVLLGAVVTRPEAIAFALLSRFAMTLADAIGLGLGALARRSRPAARDRTSAP
jgi:uncharacterized membrane protein YbhN (UPF0104 family)